MRVELLVFLAVVANAVAFVEVSRSYHKDVGIPLAAQIKESEEKIFSSARSNTEADRIVGGVAANQISHPYLAGLVINFANVAGQSVCGSVLLSNNRLVTAAHCWFDGWNQANLFTVVLGSQFLFFGGTRVATSQVITHSAWNPTTLANDVAMIYLPYNIFYTSNIMPVALPSGTQLFETFTGDLATAAGYGKTSDLQTGVTTSTTISEVNLWVITVAQCRAVFGAVYVQDSTLCTNGAGGVGICGGDSGGPLVVYRNGQPVLVGISSFVARDNCQGGFPSAFARVTSFHSFITSHL